VKGIVADTLICQFSQRRRVYLTTKGIGNAEAKIITMLLTARQNIDKIVCIFILLPPFSIYSIFIAFLDRILLH